jgi:retron-type reverse transcriptase
MTFMAHRVADNRILQLIQKWLKAGVSKDGEWSEAKAGTPQGAVISPLIDGSANEPITRKILFAATFPAGDLVPFDATPKLHRNIVISV